MSEGQGGGWEDGQSADNCQTLFRTRGASIFWGNGFSSGGLIQTSPPPGSLPSPSPRPQQAACPLRAAHSAFDGSLLRPPPASPAPSPRACIWVSRVWLVSPLGLVIAPLCLLHGLSPPPWKAGASKPHRPRVLPHQFLTRQVFAPLSLGFPIIEVGIGRCSSYNCCS